MPFSRCKKSALVNVCVAFASCGSYPRCITAAGHLLIASPSCSHALGSPASSCLEGEKELTSSQFPEDKMSFFPLWGKIPGLGVIMVSGHANAVPMWINSWTASSPCWPQCALRLSQGCTPVLRVLGHPKGWHSWAQMVGSSSPGAFVADMFCITASL